jgi:hypothetical protein
LNVFAFRGATDFDVRAPLDGGTRWVAAAVAVFATSLVSSPASADSEECVGVRVHGEPGLAPAWTEATRRAQGEAESAMRSSALPRCIDVTVRAGPEGGHVVATTPEGRRAERAVSTPDALPATVFGLVAAIPDEQPSESPRAEPSSPLVGANLPAPERCPLDVWLGASVGTRISEPVFLDQMEFEARAEVVDPAWLGFASLRYGFGAGGADDDSTNYSEIGVGIGAGARFPVAKTTLDVALEPSLVWAQFNDQDEPGDHASPAQFRLGGSIRWSVPIGRTWLFTIDAETDVSPEGLAHPIELAPDLPALPAWSAALRVGAMARAL